MEGGRLYEKDNRFGAEFHIKKVKFCPKKEERGHCHPPPSVNPPLRETFELCAVVMGSSWPPWFSQPTDPHNTPCNVIS